MSNRASRSVLVLTAVLAVVLAACSARGGGAAPGTSSPPGGASDGTAGGSSTASDAGATPASADAIDHPTGATDIVLRVGQEGGFMMMEAVMSRVPEFTLYGDGRVLIAQPAAAAKGQAGVNGAPQQVLREAHLTEEQIQGLLRFALIDGQVGIAKESFPILVMDVPTTVIELHAGGVDKTIKAAGLGMDPAPGPDAAVLKSLATLVARLQEVPAETDYQAAASVAILAPTEPAPGTTPQPWPWPDTAPATFAQPAANDPFGFTSHVLDASEAAAIGIDPGRSAAPMTLAGPDGKTYVVVVRPALPEEIARS